MNSQNDSMAPSGLESSTGGALHLYHRDHGFDSCSSLDFFRAFFSLLL